MRSPEPYKHAMRTSRFNWTVSIFPTPFDIASSVEWQSREWCYRMWSGWNCLGTVQKKKVSVSQAYTIVRALHSWIKLLGCSCSSPLALAHSVCITPTAQSCYPRRNTNLHSFGVGIASKSLHRWTAHFSLRAAQKFSCTKRHNPPISRASKLDSTRPFKTWRGLKEDFPTLKMTSLACTKLIGSCESGAGKTSVPVSEAVPL